MEGLWRVVLIGALCAAYNGASADNRKRVGSKYCVAAQYCEEENAIKALQDEFELSVENATEYISNKTIHKSCSCQDSCAYLGICCQDWKVQIPSRLTSIATRLKANRGSYTCRTIIGKDAIIINTCPSTAPLVMRRRCGEVVEMALPASSNASTFTYKNIYCGLCNGEHFDDLKSWSFNFDCIKNLQQWTTPMSTGTSILKQTADRGCWLSKTIPMLPPKSIEVHHSIGVYLDSLNICSSPPISSCPRGASGKLNCTMMPLSLVVHDGRVYRNEHCLRCNRGTSAVESALCEACEEKDCKHSSTMIHSQLPLLASFGILVQPYNDVSVVECKTANQQDCGDVLSNLATCGHGQFLDYQTTTCQDVCPKTFYLKDGACQFNEATCQRHLNTKDFKDIALKVNETNQMHGTTFILVERKPTPCYKCNNTKAITAETPYFKINEKEEVQYKSNWISPNLVFKVDSKTFYVCLDGVIKTQVVEPYKAEEFVTYFLLSLSLISLTLYFVAYVLFKRLRNIPGKIVLGNMVCLYLAYIFFLVRQVPGLVGTSGCTAIAILVDYFFMASFTFNIIYAGFIVHSLHSVDFESRANKWTAIKLWILGLLAPLIVIGPGIVLDHQGTYKFRPKFGGKECFIGSEIGQVIYFIAPVGLCLFISVALYLSIIVKLVQLARETRLVRSNHSEKIAVAIKLIIVLGFNWIFAVIATADQGRVSRVIFIVTCTLQGFFGFVVFICNKPTLVDIKKYLNKQTNIHFEMSSSATPTVGKTASTMVSKDLLRQADSNKSLLKTPGDDNISV